jgi:hypothetical protein
MSVKTGAVPSTMILTTFFSMHPDSDAYHPYRSAALPLVYPSLLVSVTIGFPFAA